MRLKSEASSFRKKTIVKLANENKTQQQIATILECSQALVSQTLKKYAELGEAIFEPQKRKGATCRMPSEMQAELSEILLQGAILYGFETNNWTQKRVQFIIQEKFAINYHYCYVSRFLSKLSFSLQKPSTYNYKKVEEDADEWRENTLPCLKKS